MRAGACADLVVLDYKAPTPITSENLAGHLLFGFSSRQVEAVMVDGVRRLWARRALSADAELVAQRARESATALWARMAELP